MYSFLLARRPFEIHRRMIYFSSTSLLSLLLSFSFPFIYLIYKCTYESFLIITCKIEYFAIQHLHWELSYLWHTVTNSILSCINTYIQTLNWVVRYCTMWICICHSVRVYLYLVSVVLIVFVCTDDIWVIHNIF